MTEDFDFTAESLQEGKLKVPNARIVEFSVEDDLGQLVLPARTFVFNSEEDYYTLVDFSGWTVEGTWHIRVIPVEPGADADPGFTRDEYLFQLYLLHGDGNYTPYRGSRLPELRAQALNIPSLGDSFMASGMEQLMDGIAQQIIIPALGEHRQYVSITPIRVLGDARVFYQFQVYRSSIVLFDVVQDSAVNTEGNICYFDDYLLANLPAKDESGSRELYFWRIRASYGTLDADGQQLWSDWSQSLPFIVNILPTAPENLSVAG